MILSIVIIICALALMFKITGWIFGLFGKILGVILGLFGYILIGGLAVGLLGLAFIALPIILVIGVVIVIYSLLTK